MNTHTEIHYLAKRVLPENVCLYKHAIMIYKLMKDELCEDEFVQLNFKLVDNARSPKLTFMKRQKYEVGKISYCTECMLPPCYHAEVIFNINNQH